MLGSSRPLPCSTLVARVSLALFATACGMAGSEQVPAAPTAARTSGGGSVQWRTYEDPVFGFAVDYPDDFVVLEEPSQLPQLRPPLLHRVRLQDRSAGGDTAAPHLPELTVEVFEGSSAPLREWLQRSNRLPPDAFVHRYSVAGAREAIRVRLLREIMPNEFYYISTEKQIFKLTPLGAMGPRMLRSFRLKAGADRD